MYKVHTIVLEGLKKQLVANNKVLAGQSESANARQQVLIAKTIKENEKQIKLLQDEYSID